ncbi:MAG TPA: helix-turn-helix transcriptional regulator [Nanoarchaeota archaeon]|nr:helix-turn-helix transcriptional regulator [Nanoarchaeota archaeon]
MNTDCTIYKTADFIGKRWALLVLLEIYKGGGGWKRYSELKRGMAGITPKILSQRLKELEKEGLVSRRADTGSVPIKVEYSLTKSGHAFMGVIKGMKQWALEWKLSNKKCENSDCSKCML